MLRLLACASGEGFECALDDEDFIVVKKLLRIHLVCRDEKRILKIASGTLGLFGENHSR